MTWKPSAELRWKVSTSPGEGPTLQQKWLRPKQTWVRHPSEMSWMEPDEEWREIPFHQPEN